jgi:predicted RNase H-like HicB family nuclease
MCYSTFVRQHEAISTVNTQYVCQFRREDDGRYTVRCDAFPELITNGRTLEEARAAAREALELCIEVYQDEGRELPESDALPQTILEEVVPVTLARV